MTLFDDNNNNNEIIRMFPKIFFQNEIIGLYAIYCVCEHSCLLLLEYLILNGKFLRHSKEW